MIELFCYVFCGAIFFSAFYGTVNYEVLEIEVVSVNDTYYNLEAYVKENRLILGKRKPFKKVFLYSKSGNLKFKGSSKVVLGYSHEVFQDCVLNYEQNQNAAILPVNLWEDRKGEIQAYTLTKQI